jgi:hypothetical protein
MCAKNALVPACLLLYCIASGLGGRPCFQREHVVKSRALVLIALFMLASASAGADTLNTFGATWNPWVAPTQRSYVPFQGTPFWDNVSKDGTQDGLGNNCNVGFWVSGTGNCDATSFYGGSFYANSPRATGGYLGQGAATFTMTADPDSTNTVAAGVGVSALSGDQPSKGSTEFGWFSLDDRDAHHAMLVGGNAVSFEVPSGEYGFYLTVTDVRDGTKVTQFYSDQVDSLGRSHFVVFDLGDGHYVIGIEDKLGDPNDPYSRLSDYDYNDLVVDMTTTTVPEPASVLLLGSGLVGLAKYARRRRAR